MRFPADLLLLALAISGIVGYRRRGAWTAAALVAIAGGLIAYDVSRHWPELVLTFGPPDLIFAVALLLVIADVQGLPPKVARRIGLGVRSREWEFDRRLRSIQTRIDRVLASIRTASAADDDRGLPALVTEFGHLSTTVKSLDAPDEEWAALRDGYGALYDEIIGWIDEGQDLHVVEINRKLADLRTRRERLRHAYRWWLPSGGSGSRPP